jgi:hypothetical protein
MLVYMIDITNQVYVGDMSMSKRAYIHLRSEEEVMAQRPKSLIGQVYICAALARQVWFIVLLFPMFGSIRDC